MKAIIQYELTIQDKHGRIRRRKKGVCHSYVLAYIDQLYAHYRSTNHSFPDTSGTPRTFDWDRSGDHFVADAPSPNTSYGPVIGSGSTPVAIDDHALETQIGHGNGAGQLNYGATGFTIPNTVGSERRFTITRPFTNNSGDTVNVREIALYVQGQDSLGTNRYWCHARDVFPADVGVLDTETGTLTYTIRTTV